MNIEHAINGGTKIKITVPFNPVVTNLCGEWIRISIGDAVFIGELEKYASSKESMGSVRMLELTVDVGIIEVMGHAISLGIKGRKYPVPVDLRRHVMKSPLEEAFDSVGGMELGGV